MTSWTIDPKQFSKQIGEDIGKLTAKIALQVANGVTELSPVFTGQFKGSWRMAVNVMDDSKVFAGKGGNIPAPTFKLLTGLTSKDKVIVSNTHKYGIYLENGSPTTIPTGMVRKTIAKIR